VAGVKILSRTVGALFGTGNFVQFLTMNLDLSRGDVVWDAHKSMMLSIAFSFIYVSFFHASKNEKLHLFNSHI